ncbi:MAG: SDR family oxidoreductase [Meiothermus sp.]|uniref:SDR family NAD(P)-dependent oxidoreductase n=1 Tax=Meiothermus sp. TaxID=1955249 RepID=UPI0026204516|nr:SDR family oxidoreductase [Meiothermus sp.]MCS7059430.1 SDR family oxidoreductase [Meiothermus sp.]MCX7739617.1 SDR family oxidoreductase [Meiothermus sp.]
MHPLFDLSGRVVLLTGGSRGIGLASATLLAELGATVVLSSEDAAACEQAARGLRARGLQALGVPCDVGDPEQIEALVETVLGLGRLDAVVACAGVAPHFGPLVEASEADWERTFRINLQANFWLARRVLPQMRRQGEGSLVFIGSLSSLRGNQHIGLYALSKAALAQLARDLAVQWGPLGVRVNAISPGLIRTAFAQRLLADEAFLKRRIAQTPLRRLGEPQDIAGVVALLVSPAGGFITGQNLVVDGGTLISDGG